MTREILPVIFKIVDSRQSGEGTYIVARFLALVTTMVTKVDHGN